MLDCVGKHMAPPKRYTALLNQLGVLDPDDTDFGEGGGKDEGGLKSKEKEEGAKLASFFGVIYAFFNPVSVISFVPVTPVPVIPAVPVGHFISSVPASSPTISFVPALFSSSSSSSFSSRSG